MVIKLITVVYRLILRSQDLGGNQTINLNNTGVTALPVQLTSPWEQGGGELGICIQALLVPIWLIHKGYYRDDMLSPMASVRCFNHA